MTKEQLNQIKEFAERNWELTEDDDRVVAEHDWVAVTNPWVDQSGRLHISDERAVSEWGLATVIDFCEKALVKLNGGIQHEKI